MKNSFQTQESQSIGPMWLSIKTVCRLTGLSRSTVSRQVKCGAAKSTKVGSRVLVAASYLEGLQSRTNKEVRA